MTDFPQGDPLKPKRPGFDEGAEEHPGEGELDQVTSQDATAPGEPDKWPTAAAPAEDEGPLGEGGQLRGTDAGGGGGF